MTVTITAYFDRSKDSYQGVFSIQVYNPATRELVKRFEKLPARSGLPAYYNIDWKRGHSPIPYSPKGQPFYLWLDPLKPDKWPGDVDQIGEFYSISSALDNRQIIREVGGTRTRDAIGLHPENGFPGSAGCIVLLHETAEQRAAVAALFRYLRELGKSRKTIDLHVI
jgi:hypothetical protein